MHESQEFDREINLYYKAIDIVPNSPELHESLGNVLSQKEQWEAAERAYRRSTQLNPKNRQAYQNLGDVLFYQKKWLTAENAYKNAIAIEPNIFWLHQKLGDVLIKQKKWLEAETAYKKAIQLKDTFFWSHQKLGLARFKQRKWQAAETAFRDALTLKSDAPETYAKLGTVLAQQQRWLEAVSAYIQSEKKQHKPNSESLEKLIECRQQLEQKSDSWETYRSILYALIKLKYWQGAVAAFWKSIEGKPEQGWWRYDRLWKLTAQQNRLKDFQQTFETSIANYPDNLDSYLNLAEVLTRQNRTSEAIDCYRKFSKREILKRYPHLSPETSLKSPHPDFIVIGAQKCGTTSLYYYLNEHPNLFLSLNKEIHFWSINYDKGLDWYLAHFPPVPESEYLLTGEASPTYLDFPEAAERLAREFPKMKLIVLLRNPADRAISHYYHWVRLGKEERSLTTAIEQQLQEISSLKNPFGLRDRYIIRGLYVEFLKHWFKFFPREQFLVLESERFDREPSTILQQTHQFLGVAPVPLQEYQRYNTSTYQSTHEDVRALLTEFYRPYNEELQTLLEMTFNWS
ncbi:tetratricopeptide repeat protein [Baaleninema sp.]|uniref:tetratricopeptide repeat protein n=1 Tax=Baaleninema sp. TaxID=3101197 RepID=UPI003CFF8472